MTTKSKCVVAGMCAVRQDDIVLVPMPWQQCLATKVLPPHW